MKNRQIIILLLMLVFSVVLMIIKDNPLLPFMFPLMFAHCDSIDGPVISAAKKALDTENVNLVLIWIPQEDEADLIEVFEQVLSIRKISPQVKELADRFFFETLVRIHRAGEGETYTGIKPAGTEIDPIIEFADDSIDNGSVDDLLDEITNELTKGIRERFALVMEKKKHKEDSVDAGREYVEAYVTYVHFVESLHNILSAKGSHHTADHNH
ncbi:MAG: hypothetical protein K0B81_03690 [Candidatus Cloacimonetes bacterium]|nr:hypothetical protein [Candidatus Cloacimonadota bacterium]